MEPQQRRAVAEMTRRNALRTGAVLTGGLVLGGTAVGTVNGMAGETVRPVPVDLFVRAEDDEEPSPIPDPQDKLVNREAGNPVDDGTVAAELDGTRQQTWGSFSAVGGKAKVMCVDGDTHVKVKMTGLVPGGLYTMWVVVFSEGGFITGTRDIDEALFTNFAGVGALGKTKDDDTPAPNEFRARGSIGMLDVMHPAGPLTVAGEVGCLLDEYETHLVAVLHLDGETHDDVPQPEGAGTLAEQVAFVFGHGV